MPARLSELSDEYNVTQDTFSSLLLDPEIPCPKGLVSPSGKVDAKRFSVYRNNVVVGLTGAIADIFPAIQRLLGEDAFMSLARLFVADYPPTSPLMFKYGAGFAEFLEAFEPLKNYPYLGDVARIERLWLDCFHETDATPIALDALAAFPAERLGDVVFVKHPASRLFSSQFAAVSIFSTNRQGASMEGINPASAEDCLISRPDAQVDVRQIPQAATIFYQTLFDGHTLGEAANIASGQDPEFDISMAISTMLEAGIFAQCNMINEEPGETGQ